MESKATNGCNQTDIVSHLKIETDTFLSLNKSDVFRRRNALKGIEKVVSVCEELNLDEVLDTTIKLLITTLNEESEKCREISINILSLILDRLSKIDTFIPPIINILALRLGKSDEREPSEEVRLLEVQFLYKLLQKHNGDLLKYLTNIANILCACIADNCPEIKRKSCECTSLLACKQQVNFHMISSSLLKPLLTTLCDQRFKTRTACIHAIGSLFLYGSLQDFKEVLPYLAQRLFDHSPAVRMAVTEVVGQWLVEFSDRYSFFQYLIPLMLSTLYDDVLDIRIKGASLWKKAGLQYLQENEKDYKDLIDFPKSKRDVKPKLQPGDCPSLGCRILVQRNVFHIIPALLNDLHDWAPETRIKSSKVLYSLILHAEDKVTIQLPSIIQGIITASKDEEKVSVQQALQSAELLGFFIEPKLLIDNILTLVYKSPSAVHLSVLAAILKGCKKILPHECLQGICKMLSDPSVARMRQADGQANLLLCVESVLTSLNKNDVIASYQIFTVLSSVSGLTCNNVISKKALNLMEKLASSQSSDYSSLYKQCAPPFLTSIVINNELWTAQSPEMPIFYFLVQSDHVTKEIIELAIPIMTNNLHTSKDAKLRGQIFSLLLKVLGNFSSAAEYEAVSDKILDLIQKGVFPNLNWSPGKTASSLRIVAAASLYEIISKNCITENMMKSISDELLTIIMSLSDDDDVSNRLLACKILELILPQLNKCVDEHKIHTDCYDILRCMDDESDEIRIMTTRVLKAYIKSFADNYCWDSYKTHLKHMFENVLIHLDDKNEKVKLSVFNFLKEAAYTAPEVLLQEVESKTFAMTSSDLCKKLIEHIKFLLVLREKDVYC